MNENAMKKCKEDDDILKILIANRDNINELKNSMNELSNAIMEFGDFLEEWIKQTESYTDLALKTLNKDVFEQKDLILNASLGLSGEVGEVNDIIKKYMYHGHKLDDDTKEKIILELGDVCWYVALMAWAIDKTKFEDVLNKNIAKLEKRYHGEFSTEKSVNRKDDSDNSCEEKKNDSNNGFRTFCKDYDYELDKMRIIGDFLDEKNSMNELSNATLEYCTNDCDFEFETTITDEEWRKLLNYCENDVAAQEEYCSRQSMEAEEKKEDTKKQSEKELNIEDMLDSYYNARRFSDFINLLFGKKDNKKPREEETRTIKDLWL